MYRICVWDDAFALPELHRLVHRVQVEEFGLTLGESYWKPLYHIANSFADGSGQPAFWVAMQGDVIVGCVGLKPLSSTASEIKRLLVLPEHRGAEVAVGLMEAVYQRAREGGITHLYLGTGGGKPRALRFYEKQGFEVVAADVLPESYVMDPLDDMFLVKEMVLGKTGGDRG